jgi:hypothetical protein
MPTPTTPFNCLIEATADNDTSYYFANVEEDGFIYFNDDRFFRVETPQNVHDIETAGQTITITSGIQLWYVVRDVWVYSNLFDSLTLEMIHGSDIDKQDLQTGLNTINGYINSLGRNAIGNNGQQLLNLYNAVLQIASDLNGQGISVTTPQSGSVYTSWTDNPNYTLQ